MSRALAAVLFAAVAVHADHVHCHAGSYEVTVELFGSTTCVPCAKGRYQDQDHQKSCKECPTGKYSDSWRAAACHSCPQGRISQYIDRKACVEPPPAELANGFGHHAANETLGTTARNAHSGDVVAGSAPSDGLVQHIIHSETHRIEQWSTHQKLGSAPFLYPREDGPDSWSNPGNIKDSIGACQEQCMQVERCAYGTYITSGERAGECWLAAQTLLPLSHSESCGVPCISFRKVESTTGEVAPYMSPGMVEEEEEAERAQLHGVESALHHAHSDGIDFDDMQLSSFHHSHPELQRGHGIAAHVSTLSAAQSELDAELHHQEAMIQLLHKEQTELQRNISAQLYTLHKRQLVLHEKHAQHRDMMHRVVAEQAGLQQKLTLLESKLLAIAPKSGLNYTELENAIDAQVALSLQNHDHDHGLSAAGEHSMDSAAELALALDAAHRQAVAHAGGFAHFEKAGLVCQAPPIPQNGYTLAFSKSDRVVGGKVRFSCNYGFKLVGDGVRKCQSDLRWSGQVTFCETFTPVPTPAPTPVVTQAPTPAPTPTKHCGRVPQPPNALVAGVDLSLPSYPPGAIVFFRCKEGFRRIGQDASKCDGGTWHSPPSCVAGAHVCSHLSCKLRRTHEVVPGHPGYHLQIHHDRFEQRGTKHRCQYHGDPQEGKLDPTDCVCLCWDTATSVLRR